MVDSKKNPKRRRRSRRCATGPLLVTGKIEVQREDGTVETLPRATLCRCGESQHKPFCDNQHIAISFRAPGVPFRIHLSPVRSLLDQPMTKARRPARPMSSPGRDGSRTAWPELPYSVWKDTLATLHDFMSNLSALGIEAQFRPIPDEVTDPIPFAEDTVHHSYEPEWANRFWRVLTQVDLVLKDHRSRFRGRTSPVHFFWGTFDLALTRFSGRAAQPTTGAGIIRRRSADAEQICAGFWPGNQQFPRAAFFAYTYPKPDGIEEQVIEPADARWSADLGEFALPYDDVRASASPQRAILQFFGSTYAARARLGGWDPGLLVERAH